MLPIRWESQRRRQPKRVLLLERLDARLALAADAVDLLLDHHANSEFDFSNSFGEVGARIAKSTRSISPNSAPTLAKAVAPVGTVNSTGNRVTLSVLGADDQGEKKLTYSWSKLSGPGTTTFSANDKNAAKRTNVTVSAAGTYQLQVTVKDASGLSTKTNYTIIIAPVLKQLSFEQNLSVLRSGATSTTSSNSTSFRIVALDQFKQPMSLPANMTMAVTKPAASNPVVHGTSNVNVSFDRAGVYQFRASVGKVSTLLKVNVVQTLKSIAIQPVDALAPNAIVQLRSQALDQFNQPMSNAPKLTWSTTAGTVTSAGRLTAPSAPGQFTVTATSGSITAGVSLTIQATQNLSAFQDAQIAGLVKSYFADGSITRTDMISLLRQAGVDGSVSTAELTDLRNLVKDAQKYAIPDYVRGLADDVVNANLANATYQGNTLGNLAAGSSATHLNKLVDKWFLGTDRPALTSNSFVYRPASGSLFNGDPKYTDQRQGQLGDCYLVSSLGIIAMSEPDAIRNMFIDNKDGTFTIRFYAGAYGSYSGVGGSIVDGFSSGKGAADYVTVDRLLPATSWGAFAYSSGGGSISSTGNTLWLALAEKAYAQWNETGNSGRAQVVNSFAAIEGGWMSRVNAQVLGYNSNNYPLSAANKLSLVNALNSDQAVTFGTKPNGQSGALVGSHAYGIIDYNAATDRFQLHNPWGSHQPAAMTYAELQASGTYFIVADASKYSTNVATLSVNNVKSDGAGFAYVELVSTFNELNDRKVAENSDANTQNPLGLPVANAATQVGSSFAQQQIAAKVAGLADENVGSPEASLFASLDAIDAYFAELDLA